jgi:hypothetical protein
MLSRLIGILAMLAASFSAQSPCPLVKFLAARRANLKPSPTSHIDVVRQSDGSYTGFEIAEQAAAQELSRLRRRSAEMEPLRHSSSSYQGSLVLQRDRRQLGRWLTNQHSEQPSFLNS